MTCPWGRFAPIFERLAQQAIFTQWRTQLTYKLVGGNGDDKMLDRSSSVFAHFDNVPFESLYCVIVPGAPGRDETSWELLNFLLIFINENQQFVVPAPFY